MSATLEIHEMAATDTYEDMRPIIMAIVNQFMTKNPALDVIEVESAASLGFARAYRTYNGKSEFNTWLTWCVRSAILDYQRSVYRPRNQLLNASTDDGLENVEQTERNLDMRLSEMTEESQFVVNITKNPPAEVTKRCKALGPVTLRKGIKCYLSSLGWTAKQITDSFTEIWEVLYDA